jgi:hypothetical protein
MRINRKVWNCQAEGLEVDRAILSEFGSALAWFQMSFLKMSNTLLKYRSRKNWDTVFTIMAMHV